MFSGQASEKTGVYNGVQEFLRDNPLIREGIPFELKVENDPAATGVYEFRGINTLLNIRTHQSYPADIRFFDGKKKVTVRIVNGIEVIANKRIATSLARETLTYLKEGIKTDIRSEKLGSTEKAELISELNKAEHLKGKALNQILVEQAEKVTRRVVSLDFESHIDDVQKRISFENIYSAGITETVETIYTLPEYDGVLSRGRLKNIRSYKDKLTTYFDINMMIEYADKGISERNKYGKKNIALMYDAIRAYVSGESFAPAWMNENQKKWFEKSRQRAIAKLGSIAKKIKEIKPLDLGTTVVEQGEKHIKDFIRAFENAFQEKETDKNKLKDFLVFLKEEADDKASKRNKDLASRQSSHMIYGEVYLGVVQRQLDEKRGRQTYYEETKITNNLMGSVTEAVNRMEAKQVSIYSSAETGAFNIKINALESELKAAKARGANKETIKDLEESLILLKNAKSKLVDIKSVTETLFDRLLPNIKANLSDTSTGVTRILEKFVPISVLRNLQESTVGSFIGDRGKGLSLENLYQILLDPGAKEFHTGALDARDLNHVRLILESIFSGSNHYRSKTVQKIKGTNLRTVTESPYGLVDLSATVARKIQLKIATDYIAQQSSIEDIFNIINNKKAGFSKKGVNVLGKLYSNLKKSLVKEAPEAETSGKLESEFRNTFKKELESLLIKKMDADFNSSSAQYVSQMERLSKFSTKNPGLLAKALTSPAISRVAALAGFLWLVRNNAEDSPGASIETGEHNSMETVARRVLTTPFNSAISLGVVGKFAEAILKRIKLKPSDFSRFSLSDKFIQGMEKRALMPAVISSEKRAIQELLEIEQYSSVLNKTTPRVEKLILDRTIRNRLSSPTLNRKLQELVRSDRLSVWNDLKISLDKAYTSKNPIRYQVSKGFFIGSSGPSDKVKTFGLTFPRAGRDVYIDQSNVFSFMRQNIGILAADESYIATRIPKVYSFDKPSFSPYWIGRTHLSKKTYKSAAIFEEPILLPYNQEIKIEPTGFIKDQSYLSSIMANRKSLSKYDRFISFNRGGFELKSYHDYDGTLMKSDASSTGKSISNGSLLLAKMSRERVPNTTIIGVPESLLDNKPVLVNSSKKPQFLAPIHSKDKGIDQIVRPIIRQPKRLDPNDYIEDANIMLSGKGGFQTAGNYPPTTSQVMNYINSLALRY